MPPWWLILLGVSLAFGMLAWVSRRTRMAALPLNVAAVFLALAGCEFYLDYPYMTYSTPGDQVKTVASVDRFMLDDNLLGYAPKKDSRVTVRTYYSGKLAYQAVYTITKNGLRVTPPHRQGALRGCIIFFGDSFTFGNGLNDDKTYPYRIGNMLGAGYATYNFAFSGYGPHQMLAELQAKRVEGIIDCRPTQFFYLFIHAHVARAAGLIDSHRATPRYRLDADERAVRDGTMHNPVRLFGNVTLPRWTVDKFRIWQTLFGSNRPQTEADLKLTIAVMREAVNITRKRYPESKFDVILYDSFRNRANYSHIIDAMEAALHAMHVPTHRISVIIPDIRIHRARYQIPLDGHPNARADALLADYIVNSVILPNQQPATSASQ
jgi:hypothetical protein